MKKFLFLMLAVVLALALVGCGAKDDVDDVLDTDTTENEETEIVEPVDEEGYEVFQFVRLKENPTTGYKWSYEIEDDTIAVVESDEYTAPSEKGVAGAAGEHTYRISGLSEGETMITFNYARPWESGEEPEETVTYKITVNANNKLKVEEYMEILEDNFYELELSGEVEDNVPEIEVSGEEIAE